MLKSFVRKASDESKLGQRRSSQSTPWAEKEDISWKEAGVGQRRDLFPMERLAAAATTGLDADHEVRHPVAGARGWRQMAPAEQ